MTISSVMVGPPAIPLLQSVSCCDLAISIHDGVLDARQGPADRPDLVVEIGLDPSIDVMLRRIAPAAAIASGDATVIAGTESDFERLVDAVAWVP